jgi:hypothetical protein
MGLLCGRAEHLISQTGDFWPGQLDEADNETYSVTTDKAGAGGRYKLKKKEKVAYGPTAHPRHKMVCAFCGQHPAIGVDWSLQQYFDNTVHPASLTRGFFCPRHNFERLLLRRPHTGTQIKTIVWSDLRKVALRDREVDRNWRWCTRFWVVLFCTANVVALILAAIALAVSVQESHCNSLQAIRDDVFEFDPKFLQSLRIKTTRGLVTTTIAPADALVRVRVHTSADDSATLAAISVTSGVDTNGAAHVLARHTNAKKPGGSTVQLTECVAVAMDVQLPLGLALGSYAVEQRWAVDNCTVSRDDFPFSLVPRRLLAPCVIGGLVPLSEPLSIRTELPGLVLGAVELSTNRGAVEVHDVAATGSLRVLAARGINVSGLRAHVLRLDSRGGDIRVERVELAAGAASAASGVAALPQMLISRGAGWPESSYPRWNTTTASPAWFERDGTVTVGLVGGVGAVRIHGGAGRTDVAMTMHELQPWEADIESCGGVIRTNPKRLEAAPRPLPLPLICQQLFDNRWGMCEAYAVTARAAGKEHVTADYASNGFCDADLNVEPCFDGGDCCESTCDHRKYPQRCGVVLAMSSNVTAQRKYDCVDQFATENYGPLPDCGAILLAQDAYWGEQLTVRAHPGRLSALSDSHSKSVLYGVFVWTRGALNSLTRRLRPGQVWQRQLALFRAVAGWPAGSAMPDTRDGIAGAASLGPQAGDAIGRAGQPWGWHTCSVAAGPIFRENASGVTRSTPHVGGGAPAVAGAAAPARSRLKVQLAEGDVELILVEALPFAIVWDRHVNNKKSGLDCSQWECVDRDECVSSPCLNGGVCRDSTGLDLAQLSPTQMHARGINFTLADGSADVNASDASFAVGNSSVDIGYYNCSCPATFVGSDCEIALEYAKYRVRFDRASTDGQSVCLSELWFYSDGAYPDWQQIRGPTLAGVTTDSPTIRNSNFSSLNILDGYKRTTWCSDQIDHADDGLPIDLFVAFPEPRELTGYAVQVAGASEAPHAWQLAGLDRNALIGGQLKWVLLDEQRPYSDGGWRTEQISVFGIQGPENPRTLMESIEFN